MASGAEDRGARAFSTLMDGSDRWTAHTGTNITAVDGLHSQTIRRLPLCAPRELVSRKGTRIFCRDSVLVEGYSFLICSGFIFERVNWSARVFMGSCLFCEFFRNRFVVGVLLLMM